MKDPARRLIGAIALLALAAAPLAGCFGPEEARVSAGRLALSRPENGVMRVSGQPGAVSGASVTTVTLTVMRERGTGAYRVRHLGAGGLPIASSYAKVAPDGSFPEVALGAADRPIASGDELNVTPQAGFAQAGPTVSLPVP